MAKLVGVGEPGGARLHADEDHAKRGEARNTGEQRDLVDDPVSVQEGVDVEERIVFVLGLRRLAEGQEEMRLGPELGRDLRTFVEALGRAKEEASHVHGDAARQSGGLRRRLALLEAEVALLPGEEVEDRVFRGGAQQTVHVRAPKEPLLDELVNEGDRVRPLLPADPERLGVQHASLDEPIEHVRGVDRVRLAQTKLLSRDVDGGALGPAAQVEVPLTPCEEGLQDIGETELA